MVVPIPENTEFSYNGFVFPVYCKTKVTEEPIQSGDGRQIKYSKITISVTGWLTQNDAGTTSQISLNDIEDGGAGYEIGDVLTVEGGMFSAPMQITVDDVDEDGAVTEASTAAEGSYTVLPSNPAPVTGGEGAGFMAGLAVYNVTPNTLDAAMLSIRRTLQVNGKRLAYKNRGYGMDLVVNDPAGLSDVAMGPKSGKFSFFPLGGAPDGIHGAGFQWEVSTCIAECQNFSNAPGPGVFMEISFTVTYETGHDGLVVITHHGTAQIPLRVLSNNTLQRNIDDVIANVIKPPAAGFLRKMTRQLSADRASCAFTITDTQIEVPYPDRVVHIEMNETIKQGGKNIWFQTWVGTISGTVRMDPGARKSEAWTQFWNIAAYRMTLARTTTQQGMVIPGPVEFSENLFKNESSFTINFTLSGASFDSIIRKSGLWTPIAGIPLPGMPIPFNAVSSAASLAGSAQKTKGILGASFDNDNEILIDVCTGYIGENPHIGDPPFLDMTPDDLVALAQADEPDDETEETEPDQLIEAPGLSTDDSLEALYPPEVSWIAYVCIPERVVDYNQIRHKPLSGTTTTVVPEIDPFADVDELASDVSDPTPGWTATVPDIIQQTCSPSFYLRLKGFGVRVAWRVNPPKLISYGGQPAILQREQVSEQTMGLAGDVTVYRTQWDLLYLIPSFPTSLPLPANPLLGVDGQKGDGGESGMPVLQTGIPG